MAEKDKGAKPAGKKQKTPLSVRFTIFMIFVSALVFLPTTIVFSVCLVPTLVAAIVDNNQQKTAWLTVGAMNLAGTIPVWFFLWDDGHTIPAAFQLVSQPRTILISYGGAAVGWMLYNYIPPFVAVIVMKKNERRLRDIENRQKELLKKWGEDVTSA